MEELKKKYTPYTESERMSYIREYLSTSETKYQFAKRTGICRRLLILWLEKYHINDLNDASAVIEHNGDSILLSGLDFRLTMQGLRSKIDYANTSMFNILLYHGTDKFDGIAPYNYDLVLSGHTHGGIVCLPFVGGIITNEKELFPKYDSGIFTSGLSTMISSRGLGDAAIPRFHNPREVICITLHHTS